MLIIKLIYKLDVNAHLVIAAPIAPAPVPAPILPAPVLRGGDKFEEILKDDYETDVDSEIMSTNNSIIGTRFFVPKAIVKDYKENFSEFTIVPNLAEFSKEKFKDKNEYDKYILERLNFYYVNGFDIYDGVSDKKLEQDKIEILNLKSLDDYVEMLKKIEGKNIYYNPKTQKIEIPITSKIEITQITPKTQITPPIIPITPRTPIIPNTQTIAVAAGGGNDPYYLKYLKYKQKYLELKNKL